ncbi:MAG: VWA domain-containing protein [Gammaproteobacteria bacterium]|nr:VWA domain-containing protein [Gammaproteobacteria bacterium]MBQ0840403.1 VWA domain-containing protein [Gammaproteobacteria bacterium]
MSLFTPELATVIAQFHWLRPWWLAALLPGMALALLLARRSGNNSNWQGVIAPELLPYLVEQGASAKRQRLHWWLLAPWLCACIALAGPSWHKIPLPIHKQQTPLVILLDLSVSMLAQDIKPNRLTRARLKLIDLLHARKEGTTALVAYAGDAHVVTPLTDDTATIIALLPALNPGLMPVAGNQPRQALEKGIALINKSGFQNGHILLLSDGLPSADLAPMNAQLEEFSGIKVSVLTVGTKGGAPIPSPSAAGKGGFVKDSQGNIVLAKLREAPLRSLAQNNAGIYRKITLDDSDITALSRLFDSADSEQSQQLQRTFDTWHDSGFWLILPLLPFLILAFRHNVLALFIIAPLLFAPDKLHAMEWQDLWLRSDQQGQQALAAGDAESAEALFKNPNWKGSAAYKNDNFSAAEEHFKNSEPTADSLYNLANAQAKAGQLEAALASYQAALQLEDQHEDAAFNKDLVEKALQQQKQQQKEQSEDDKDQQEGEKSDDNKDESKEGQSSDSKQDGEEDDKDSAQPKENKEQASDADKPQEEKKEDANDESDSDAEQKDDASAGEDKEQKSDQEKAQDAAGAEPSAADKMPEEQRQALEQWLRRVPDDPSGLMRRKFEYEAWQHKQQTQGRGGSSHSPSQETERW